MAKWWASCDDQLEHRNHWGWMKSQEYGIEQSLNRELRQREVLVRDGNIESGCGEVSLQGPQHRLSDEAAIGLVLPIVVEVQAGEAE